MISHLMFLLRFFKYYKNQNLKKDYFFLIFYFIHYFLFILLHWNENILKIMNNMKRYIEINLLQNILFLQLPALSLFI